MLVFVVGVVFVVAVIVIDCVIVGVVVFDVDSVDVVTVVSASSINVLSTLIIFRYACFCYRYTVLFIPLDYSRILMPTTLRRSFSLVILATFWTD